MPSLFSGAVESKINLVGLIWSGIMTISVISILFTFIYTHLTETHYMNLAKTGGYDYSQNDDVYYVGENEGENNEKESGDGDKDIYYYYYILSNTKSLPLFVSSIYASSLVGLISIYGSMFVIGFVSPTGKFVKPFFRADDNSKASLHYGIFLGILFVFASLCFLCSLIFSNVWVSNLIKSIILNLYRFFQTLFFSNSRLLFKGFGLY